ncbi:MAG TPA: AAA family ATPase [Bryobacteraceae bacterium]|nr:AAA family ATPase [Bryobacteraceae bacterium]
MKRELTAEPDLETLPGADDCRAAGPTVLDVAGLLALDVPTPTMLIENVLPGAGASLLFGAPKSNKTLVAIQAAISVASGSPFCDYYKIVEPGPVFIVEQDDPAGAASVKTILERSAIPVSGIPFFLAPRVPFSFGLEFMGWLEAELVRRHIRLAVLDSYTALRSSRGSGVDIVKAEQSDMTVLDELAKRARCAILIVHHSSKGAAGLDWSNQAAGTFAMSAATEAQLHISRFADLDSNAPERLVRVRGRHLDGTEMVLRFRRETLDHEHVMKGGAAPLYPLVLQLRSVFGREIFGQKELSLATGVSRSTAGRQIDKLHRARALTKRGFGDYEVVQ